MDENICAIYIWGGELMLFGTARTRVNMGITNQNLACSQSLKEKESQEDGCSNNHIDNIENPMNNSVHSNFNKDSGENADGDDILVHKISEVVFNGIEIYCGHKYQQHTPASMFGQ